MATLTKELNNKIENKKTYSTSTFGNKTGINTLSIDPVKTNSLGNAAILARSGIPDSHRRVADGFMIVKRIFGFPVVQSQITEEERNFIAKYDFNPLEYSTVRQINEELTYLKKWSSSRNPELQEASDKIIQIRAKELKYHIATNYVSISSDVYNGFKALERYFEDISKYAKER